MTHEFVNSRFLLHNTVMDCRPDCYLPSVVACLGRCFRLLAYYHPLPFFMSDFPASIFPCLFDSLPVCFTFDCLPTSSEVLLSVSCSRMYSYANISRISLSCLPPCLLCLPAWMPACLFTAGWACLNNLFWSCLVLNRLLWLHNAFFPIRLVALPCQTVVFFDCLAAWLSFVSLLCCYLVWLSACMTVRCPFVIQLSCLIVCLHDCPLPLCYAVILFDCLPAWLSVAPLLCSYLVWLSACMTVRCPFVMMLSCLTSTCVTFGLLPCCNQVGLSVAPFCLSVVHFAMM